MKKESWANGLLSRHWADLEAWVRDPDTLPIIASSHGRSLRFDMLGCGSWGCVAPTSARDVVLKVTTDPTEAAFAATCAQAGNPYPGIVRYHDVVAVPGERSDSFLIWREEAHDVGIVYSRPISDADDGERGSELYTDWGPDAGFYRLLDLFRFAAEDVRRQLRPRFDGAALLRASLSEAHDVSLDGGLTRAKDRLWKALLGLRGERRVAFGLAACRRYAALLAERRGAAEVGAAMAGWIDRGVLLADVHAGNIGRIYRDDGEGAVITDPGHAVFLVGSAPTVAPLPAAAALETRANAGRRGPGAKSAPTSDVRITEEGSSWPGLPDVVARWTPSGCGDEEGSYVSALMGDGSSVASLLSEIGAQVVADDLDGSPERIAYVHRLFVCDRERRRGVGRSLMTALLGRLFSMGAVSVYLEAAPEEDNLSADELVAFYESLGFRRDRDEPNGNLMAATPEAFADVLDRRRGSGGASTPADRLERSMAQPEAVSRRKNPGDGRGGLALPTEHRPTAEFLRRVRALTGPMGEDMRLAPRDERALCDAAIGLDGAPIGQGKDRLAFEVNGYVVKVARLPRGMDANRSEARRWAAAADADRRWLLPVHAADPDGAWLVMDRADEDPVDESWMARFEAWAESGATRPVSGMPRRALLDAIEHAYDRKDWLSFRGRPVLYDYA